jgi:hypothetical protein
MKKLILTEENYFSPEASQIYTGSSEIKNFISCEAKAMAELNGEWIEETSDAMLVSSYVDAAISNELDIFKEQHPEIFTKQGELKAQYKNAEEIVKQIKDDPIFYKYLQGESQKIMVGEVSGVPVKIKIDSYHPEKLITDLKTIKNFDLIWDEKDKTKKNFIDYYDYVLQGALYQEICYQNTGKKLPFVIAAATKEKVSQRALLLISQDKMEIKMQFLKEYLPHLQAVKQGKVAPVYCGKCQYCLSKKKTQGVVDYEEFFKEEV